MSCQLAHRISVSAYLRAALPPVAALQPSMHHEALIGPKVRRTAVLCSHARFCFSSLLETRAPIASNQTILVELWSLVCSSVLQRFNAGARRGVSSVGGGHRFQCSSHRLLLFLGFILLIDWRSNLHHVDEWAAAGQRSFGVSFGVHRRRLFSNGHRISFELHFTCQGDCWRLWIVSRSLDLHARTPSLLTLQHLLG